MLHSKVVRDGITAGIIGASAVAIWFFIADLLAGTPLHTPQLLAGALFAFFGGDAGSAVLVPVAVYTAFHFAAFVVVGVVLAATLEATRYHPGHLAGFFLLFAVFEAGFYGLCLMLSMLDKIGTLAWYQIGTANLFAAGVMGAYLWRQHPEALHGLDAALKGTTP